MNNRSSSQGELFAVFVCLNKNFKETFSLSGVLDFAILTSFQLNTYSKIVCTTTRATMLYFVLCVSRQNTSASTYFSALLAGRPVLFEQSSLDAVYWLQVRPK